MRIGVSTLSLVGCVLVTTTSSYAADKSWIGPNNGLFFDPANWSPAGSPGASDQAIFNLAAPRTVSFAAVNPTNQRLIVSGGVATFDLISHTYTLSTASGSSIIIGETGGASATLSLNGGTLAGVKASLGTATASTGTLHVVLSSHLDCSASLNVGVGGSGFLNCSGTASTLASSGGVIGDLATGYGEAFIQGGSNSWTNSGSLVVGAAGIGLLTGDLSATVSNTSATIGRDLGADGTVNFTFNAAWNNSGALTVGSNGTGDFKALSGADITCANLILGNNSTGDGIGLVRDIGSSLTATGTMYVGYSGGGGLTISNGAQASCTSNAFIGYNAGSTGDVAVSGLPLAWTVGASLYVGESGDGTLTIGSGGQVTSDRGIIGASAGGVGAVTVTNPASRWDCDTIMVVGLDGTADLLISNGGVVTSAGVVSDIGNGAASLADVTITGAGSRWDCNSPLRMSINGGTSQLTVLSGGVLSTPDDLTVHFGGTVRGDGTIDADVLANFGGSVAPGLSPGILNVDGDFLQNASGKLNIELGGTTPGTGYDRLAITGAATLSGTLVTTLLVPYVPALNDTFTVLTAGSRSGAFATVSLPALPSGLAWRLLYGPTDVRLRVRSACSVADIAPAPSGDGSVDVNDLLAVITTWGACPLPCPGAGTCPADIAPAPIGNCSVDVNDLLAVITNWGACP